VPSLGLSANPCPANPSSSQTSPLADPAGCKPQSNCPCHRTSPRSAAPAPPEQPHGHPKDTSNQGIAATRACTHTTENLQVAAPLTLNMLHKSTRDLSPYSSPSWSRTHSNETRRRCMCGIMHLRAVLRRPLHPHLDDSHEYRHHERMPKNH